MKELYKIRLCILLSLLILLILGIIYNLNKNTEKFIEYDYKDVEFYALYIPKRKEYIKDVLGNFSFKLNYILGVDKNELNIDKLIQDNIITYDYSIKKANTGRVACHLGHLKILKEFLKTDKKYAIIFEDDISINNYLETEYNIKRILNNLPKKFDIIYFDYCWSKCKSKKNYNEYFNYSNRTLCRHFYLVSRNGAEIIINNTLPMFTNGDEMYSILDKNKKLISYDVKPKIFEVKQNRKLLGSELKNNPNEVPPKCI